LLQNQAIPVSTSSPHNSARSAQNFANEKAGFLPSFANNESVSTFQHPNDSLGSPVVETSRKAGSGRNPAFALFCDFEKRKKDRLETDLIFNEKGIYCYNNR
jgi:hypothetical protein